MAETGPSGRRGGVPPDEAAIAGGPGAAVRRLPGATRLALRLGEADAHALGGAFGFRLDQANNRLVANGAMISARLGPDEWLTVAARDSGGPMMSGQIDDAMTILLRIRGTDLAAYAADRSRREEVRKRVEVRLF